LQLFSYVNEISDGSSSDEEADVVEDVTFGITEDATTKVVHFVGKIKQTSQVVELDILPGQCDLHEGWFFSFQLLTSGQTSPRLFTPWWAQWQKKLPTISLLGLKNTQKNASYYLKRHSFYAR